jgi:ABC-type antimicrobial peptide transport system permease subunit
MRSLMAVTEWLKGLAHQIWVTFSFMMLVILYSVKLLLEVGMNVQRFGARFWQWGLRPVVVLYDRFYDRALKMLDGQQAQVSRSYLIELSFRNMRVKRTRTIVTIGGMAIGIAFIVFLVSVGYGLQNLVTSRVARLEELQQAEVLPGLSEELALDDSVLSRLQSLPEVKTVLPLISVVGKVSYQESVSDLAVYGVTTDYLASSAIQPIRGRLFTSDELIYLVETGSEDQILNDEEEEIEIEGEAAVDETAVSQLAPAGSDGVLPLVSLDAQRVTGARENKRVVAIAEDSLREAVVNRAVLSLLGLDEKQAVGQEVTLTFIAVGDLIAGEIKQLESVPTKYKIVGVTPEEETPVVYVPFIELRSLGIEKFSQIKVITHNQGQLAKTRASVEAMGYGTVSVVDTVAQINNLFASFRLILGVVGMVALSVATLGMFNTLTVSLLERTREVGLMKAMGMKSSEVKELFLTESMIMGFYGGLFGLVLGFIAGKLLSIVLSGIAVVRGVGLIDVSLIPPTLMVIVLILSLVVGIATGYYPAKRATKISALNALRYE